MDMPADAYVTQCVVQAAEAYGVQSQAALREFRLRDGRNGEIRRLPDGNYEIGIMRIPSQALPALSAHGIGEDKLKDDACLNAQVGVYMIRVREVQEASAAVAGAQPGGLRPLPLAAGTAATTVAGAGLSTEQRRRQCMVEAASHYKLPLPLLLAIAKTEGGSTGTVSRNRNGTVDLGVMQINSIHLTSPPHSFAARGITAQRLANDDCLNIAAGAHILRHEIDRAPDFWVGVSRYHSRTPVYASRYLRRVVEHLRRITAGTGA